MFKNFCIKWDSMSIIREAVNSKVAQLKHMLEKDMIRREYSHDGKWILDKINNTNNAIVQTNYLQLHHTEWIGCTILHFAAMERDLDAFVVLLSNGADFTKKNCQDSTVLHLLIQQDPASILEEFTMDDTFVHLILLAHLKNSNFENPSNDNGLSHFHIACAANNVEVVEGFLSSGVLIDHAVNSDSLFFGGFTSLHFAARFCALDVLEVLLSHGADVHAKDAKRMTPLVLALESRLKIINTDNSEKALRDTNQKILKLFLEIERKNHTMALDEWGLSHFHVACTLKDSKIAESLLQKYANIDHTVKKESPLWPGYSALHFAALCNIDTVKLLMKKGANISIKDAKGVTPFDICIERCKAKDIYAVISLNPNWKNIMMSDGKTRLTDLVFAMRNSRQFRVFLKKLNKNISIYNSPLWPGCSPMHLAVIFSSKIPEDSEQVDKDVNLQILKYLLKQNPVIIQTRDVDDRTPLHLAFRLNKKPALDLIFSCLERCNYFTDCVDKDGLSYLHIAAAENKIKVLNILLTQMNTNVNAVYKGKSLVSPTLYSGSTPLHLAMINRNVKVAEALLNHGANVYAKDSNDMTPIHMLLWTTKRKLADMLLESPNVEDHIASVTGLSHLHVACHSGSYRAVERLLNNGTDVNGIVNYQNEGSNQLPFLEKYAGYSPLLIAYQHGVREKLFIYEDEHRQIVALLLNHGADMFVKNSKDMPLLYAVFEEMDADLVEMFVSVIKENDAMKTRLEDEIGMTSLHLACADMDIEAINALIDERVDVNAQISFDAPIFQGYTPFHIIMHASAVNNDEDVDEAIELLLKAGAKVTLQSVKSETVVHMAYKLYNDISEEPRYIRVNVLLKAQRHYSVNPTNNGNLSHFHVACSVCNVDIVEKFLSQGNIDIDQAIDYLYEHEAGYSPLHLAAGSHFVLCGAWKQLRTIDMLLKNGADVRAEDHYGDTPLHESARYNSLDLFERLVRGGADVNARNSCGDTPLACFLESSTCNISAEKIKVLLRCGCHMNTFNPVTNKGYLGVAARKMLYTSMNDVLIAIIVNFEQEMKKDNRGRTIIHNMVSAGPSDILVNEYAQLIELLSKGGCDVDSQDHLGQTALHMAVKFHNFKATAGLLMAGADVNTTDVYSKTAFTCYTNLRPNCYTHHDSINEKDEQSSIHEILAIHVKKLQLCGLDVTRQNEDVAGKVFEELENKITLSKEFFKELEDIKNIKIKPHALTLHEFLSETGVVADYPIMSMYKRDAINEFFSLSELESLRMKFPETAGILQLQYRKARMRPELVELAKIALTTLVGFRLPDICSRIVLVLLKNSELNNLIYSTN